MTWALIKRTNNEVNEQAGNGYVGSDVKEIISREIKDLDFKFTGPRFTAKLGRITHEEAKTKLRAVENIVARVAKKEGWKTQGTKVLSDNGRVVMSSAHLSATGKKGAEFWWISL